MEDQDVIEAMHEAHINGYVFAYCPICGDCRQVEPDAEGYDCFTPECSGKITSPLVKAGLI